MPSGEHAVAGNRIAIDPTAVRRHSVELLTSFNWHAVVRRPNGKEEVMGVWVGYISYTTNSKLIVGIQDGATPLLWQLIKSDADSYLWAEHTNPPSRPPKNWPHSYYLPLEINSNVFIRWLVKVNLMTMKETTDGPHMPLGVSTPTDNLPTGGGGFVGLPF
jgi:hypothetical protein